MLTKKDFNQIKKMVQLENQNLLKALHADLLRIEKKLDSIDSNMGNTKEFKRIEVSLDKFMSIFDKLSKRYVILERKMREVEDYFDPQPKN